MPVSEETDISSMKIHSDALNLPVDYHKLKNSPKTPGEKYDDDLVSRPSPLQTWIQLAKRGILNKKFETN